MPVVDQGKTSTVAESPCSANLKKGKAAVWEANHDEAEKGSDEIQLTIGYRQPPVLLFHL